MKKSMKTKLAAAAAAVVALPVLALSAHTNAIGEGQIERGDFYYAKNLTKGGSFADPIGADKCDTLQYKMIMHNPGASPVTNVTIKVNLPAGAATQNVSTATISAENAFPAVVSDTATVNLSSAQSISYISGSTELLNSSNTVVSSLPDGITGGTGVNIGTVGVSLNEIKYVQFKAKVSCPEVPKQPVYSCDAFTIAADVNRLVKVTSFSTSAANGPVFKNAVVDWGDGSAQMSDANIIGKTHQYDKKKDGTYTITATAHFTLDGKDVSAGGPKCVQQVTFKGEQPPTVTPPTTPPAAPPAQLVNTGAGSVIGLFAAAMVAGTVLYRRMLTRRLSE